MTHPTDALRLVPDDAKATHAVSDPFFCETIAATPEVAKALGLQLIGNYFKEAQLLNMAQRLQQATDWHLRTPS